LDFPANEPDKPGYRLEFQDEFEGTDLDQSKWFPHLLPHWNGLDRSKARWRASNSSLKLLIEENQQVASDWGDRASNLQTGHFSGPLRSSIGQFRFKSDLVVREALPEVRNYVPKFGYFETRLKAVPAPGYHVALWTIGYNEPRDGEIRVFEIHGGNLAKARSRIDYGLLRWNDTGLKDECFEDWIDIDASEFHIYAVEWTPERVDFYVDNRKLRTIKQSPQYPMQFMLGIYERPHEVEASRLQTPFPKICEVDYFRGFQPLSGYGS
jgi:Glycosyl hydrolases family 16